MNARTDLPPALPHSVPAEHQVLGLLMLNPGLLDHCEHLRPAAFFVPDHRTIFATIRALGDKHQSTDLVSVFETMGGAAKGCDLTYLNDLCTAATAAASFPTHVARVTDLWRKRELLAVLDRVQAQAMEQHGQSADMLIAAVRDAVEELADLAPPDDVVTFGQVSQEWCNVIENRLRGVTRAVPTGLRDLDALLDGGMERGTTFVLGARPSRGKTAFGLTIMRNVACAGGVVGVFSAEMDAIALTDRNAAAMTRLEMHRFRRPNESDTSMWEALPSFAQQYSTFRGGIVDRGPFTLATLNAKARRIRRQHRGLDLLVVDYAQLLDGADPRANRNMQLEAISRGIKALAKELDVAVLLLAQLNRASELRHGTRYTLADLRDSGSLEQDADVVAFLHYEYLDKSEDERRNEWSCFAWYSELQVAKARQGRVADIPVLFQPEYMRFADWDGPPPERAKPTQPGKTKPLFD
ncbi:replicative DNA helicase [Cupriavidus sp. Agwp_2]|uniref:replicative DNA helicase n=1 Tax=Cupriavidus sp. Agwp_2 TaxID=2897324 RepID=UPI0034616663